MTHTDSIRQLAESLCDLPYETWNFGDSVAFEGLIEATDALDEPQWAAFARGWARSWATRATPYKELDCTAPGWAIVHLAERFSDSLLVEAAVKLAEELVRRPTILGMFRTWHHAPLMHPYGRAKLSGAHAALVADPPPGSFLDCLHFDPPFLTALGRVAERPDLLRIGVDQALAYIDALQNTNGLFDHFVLDQVPGTFGPGWGRGQGWALLGLLDTIEELKAADASGLRSEIAALTSAVVSLIDGMIPLQRADGHWPTVVSVPSSGVESSTAAFMAAGFFRAAHAGIAADPSVIEAARRATDAVTTSLDEDGGLREVSAAVMACTEPTHYEHVPRGFTVPWGQGPALLALSWFDRWEEGSMEAPIPLGRPKPGV